MTSPGAARSSAACRSPPAGTAIWRVAAAAGFASAPPNSKSVEGSRSPAPSTPAPSTASIAKMRESFWFMSILHCGSRTGGAARQIDHVLVGSRRGEDAARQTPGIADHQHLRVLHERLDLPAHQRRDVGNLLLDEAPVRAHEPGDRHARIEDPHVAPLADQG